MRRDVLELLILVVKLHKVGANRIARDCRRFGQSVNIAAPACDTNRRL